MTRAITFPSATGYTIHGRIPYLNAETGIFIVKWVTPSVPTEWLVIAPTRYAGDGRFVFAADTKREALAWAKTYVETTARPAIEIAHAEALAEDAQRGAAEVEEGQDDGCPRCGGPLASDGVCADDSCGADDDSSLADSATRTAQLDRWAARLRLTGALGAGTIRRGVEIDHTEAIHMEEATRNAVAAGLEAIALIADDSDRPASERDQLAQATINTARQAWMGGHYETARRLVIQAAERVQERREADHAEALAEDAYRTELRSELAKWATGAAPYPYIRIHDGEPETRIVDIESAHAEALAEHWQRTKAQSEQNHRSGWIRRAGEINRATGCGFLAARQTVMDGLHAEALAEQSRRDAAGIIAGARLPEGADAGTSTASSLPPVPESVDDDQAWAAYCAQLPEPTEAERLATARDHGPYARDRAEAVDTFISAVQAYRRQRTAPPDELGGKVLVSLRKSMATAARAVRLYDLLTAAWLAGAGADTARDAFRYTF